MEHQTKKTAVVAGASGLVGEQLLNILINRPEYDKVITILRKPVSRSHEKLEQKIVDFAGLPLIPGGLAADHGYCCLGTTLKSAGSKEKQYIIDHDYVVSFARACHAAGVTHFAVISSIGADAGSSNFYLRTKGEMERDLQKIPFRGIYILQPSLLLGNRKEFRTGESAAMFIMKLFNPLLIGGLKKYKGIPASTVANCMAGITISEATGIRFIRYDEMMM